MRNDSTQPALRRAVAIARRVPEAIWLATIMTLAQLPVLNRTLVTLDEGQATQIGYRLATGEALYRDVHTGVFPGVYWFIVLFLWWLDRNSPGDRKAITAALEGWPLWACGLLGRAMTGFYAGSGDKHILDALEKAYSGDPDSLRWITGNMSNPWPAFDTFAWTGNPAIAAARDALFKREDSALLPSLNRYRKAPELKPGSAVDNAHVVEFIESTTPWAVGYLWTGDESYLQAAVGWHDFLDRVAMQPHGDPISDEWYGPTGALRGSETCDVAG